MAKKITIESVTPGTEEKEIELKDQVMRRWRCTEISLYGTDPLRVKRYKVGEIIYSKTQPGKYWVDADDPNVDPERNMLIQKLRDMGQQKLEDLEKWTTAQIKLYATELEKQLLRKPV